MEDALGGRAVWRAELEVVHGGGRLREQCADGGDLVVGRAVGRGGDREVAAVEVVAGAGDRQRLDRLRRGAHEAGEVRLPGLGDHSPVPHGNRVHPVHRLDDPVAAHLDDDRVHPRSLVGRLVADRHHPRGQTRVRPRQRKRANFQKPLAQRLTRSDAGAMARKSVTPTPASIHVSTHSVWTSVLFRDDIDRMLFVIELARTIARLGWTCIAVTVLGTHFHLLVETFDESLSIGMKHLNCLSRNPLQCSPQAPRTCRRRPLLVEADRDGDVSPRDVPLHRSKRLRGGPLSNAGGVAVVQLPGAGRARGDVHVRRSVSRVFELLGARRRHASSSSGSTSRAPGDPNPGVRPGSDPGGLVPRSAHGGRRRVAPACGTLSPPCRHLTARDRSSCDRMLVGDRPRDGSSPAPGRARRLRDGAQGREPRGARGRRLRDACARRRRRGVAPRRRARGRGAPRRGRRARQQRRATASPARSRPCRSTSSARSSRRTSSACSACASSCCPGCARDTRA